MSDFGLARIKSPANDNTTKQTFGPVAVRISVRVFFYFKEWAHNPNTISLFQIVDGPRGFIKESIFRSY